MEIIDKIKKHKFLMIDTAPIIYFIEENPIFAKPVNKIFNFIRNNKSYKAVSSVITLIEVLTQPLKLNRNDLAEQYKDFLLNSTDFIIYNIDTSIALKAAELRAKYNIREPDAIQIATALKNKATIFVTNDKELKKITEIDILLLDDYI